MDKDGGVTGYWYSFGIHMGLSRGPLDEIVDVTVGDRRVFPVGGTTTTTTPEYTAAPGEGGDGGGPTDGETDGGVNGSAGGDTGNGEGDGGTGGFA